MRKEILYRIEKNNERFLKMNSKSMYRKLKSSPILSFNRPNINIQIFSFLKKLLKTNLKEKNKKLIKDNNSNIQTNFEVFNKIKSFSIIKTKIIIHPLLSSIDIFQKILCNYTKTENKNRQQSISNKPLSYALY